MVKVTKLKPVHIIGGGLAGSEAAWQLARRGINVSLHEMRPHRGTNAHVSDKLAELVCSNSFRSDDADFNAVGLLHQEMRRLDSLIMKAADANKVPAGGALAVDRESFSDAVQSSIESEPLIEILREEVDGSIPEDWDKVIIASGPLTSEPLAKTICSLTGKNALFFFDAIAPIIHKDSIDFDKAWYQSRYDKGNGSDYINCPLSSEQYESFIDELLSGKKTEHKDWEGTPYFESCLPIEVMAERGRQTLAFGPMKPVGLTNPKNPTIRPHGIIQLRQDNALGTLWNMVGFQTKLTYSEQVRIFRTIPGLEKAEFARLGGLHRNTFLNSPKLLNTTLALKSVPRIRFAGQITGCEGYVESAAIGLLTGRFVAAERQGNLPSLPPETTSIGALLSHITSGADEKNFQPMNINFGLFPPIVGTDALNQKGKPLKGKDRKQAMTNRARRDFNNWLDSEC